MVKFLWGAKDGGPESKVWCWGLEIKPLFSVLILNLKEGSREAYHSHAFNAISWVLTGGLFEHCKNGKRAHYWPSLVPVVTKRSTYHQVQGMNKNNWVITFRGPWVNTWKDMDEKTGIENTLTHGRKVIS